MIPLPPTWEYATRQIAACHEPIGILALTTQRSLMPDPRWLSDHPRLAHLMRGMDMRPSYQAWRQQQVIRNLGRMGWGLQRGSRPGVWGIVGNGPGAAEPPGCDAVIAINGALELVPDADLWMVADALRPGNAWGDVITEWLVEHADAVRRARLVGRVAVRHEIVEAVAEAHFYRPCTEEHLDIIEPWISARMPAFVEGFQSLPAALHLAWWMGATEIRMSGCPQGVPASSVGVKDMVHERYYQGASTPLPEGRMARRVVVPGQRGMVWTTPEHMIAAEQADAMCWWLLNHGCRVTDYSGGLIYRYAGVPDAALATGAA